MKYIIDGRFLYGQVLGVQRYAREITAQLDKMIKDKPYDVEIAVPQIDSEGTSAEINSYKTKYDNIKIVILKGVSGRKWEQLTFQHYVNRQKAKPVYCFLGSSSEAWYFSSAISNSFSACLLPARLSRCP